MVAVRRLSAADAEALGVEFERAKATGDMRASSDPDAAFFMKNFPVDPSLVGGAFVGDQLVGYISPEFKVVVVRPPERRRGIGRALVDLAFEMERDRGRPDVLLGVLPGDDEAKSFVRALGFRYHSTVWDLDLPRDHVVPPPVWPAGLVARPFERDRDPAAFVTLLNAAFADHPTPFHLDATTVAAILDDPDIRDEDTELLEDVATGELVGFWSSDVRRVDGVVQPHSEIWSIGVRPDRQGQGIGRQLLRSGVSHLRGIGVLDVSLAVNGRNEGALGLYESEGFAAAGRATAGRDRSSPRCERQGGGGRRPREPSMAARGHCPAAATGGPGRCDVHRVLRDPLPLRGRLAVDGDGLPLPVRLAGSRGGRLLEQRRFGAIPRSTVGLAAIAGVFFAGDLTFWHHAVDAVGAGLATVLGNLQVLVVGFVAWAVFGERPTRSTLVALPIVIVGVALISGVVGERRLRGVAGARRDLRDVDGVLLRRIPPRDPSGRTRSPSSGRASRDRDGIDRSHGHARRDRRR